MMKLHQYGSSGLSAEGVCRHSASCVVRTEARLFELALARRRNLFLVIFQTSV